MTKPQQPELHRSRLGSTDQDGAEIRAGAEHIEPGEGESSNAPVPEANQAPVGGHQGPAPDKPDYPPHERAEHE